VGAPKRAATPSGIASIQPAFALVGAVIIIQVIIVYTTAGYFIFRGKVTAARHYD
jgi:cytochrome bd-type quinol oxidase subunit 2